MRRVCKLSGLSGLVMTGLMATHAFAAEPADADTDSEQAAEAPKTAPSSAPAPAAVPAPPAAVPDITPPKPKFGDVSTSGYFRGGFGASNQKGRQTCFSLSLEGGQHSKYRLGNECEVWAEMQFNTVVYAGDDDTVATLHFMPVAFIPTTFIGYTANGNTSSLDLTSQTTGATVGFPNLYVDIKGISWLSGGTAWVGTRYYKRESIYISDFFYWNPSGVGAGIEDIHLNKDLRLSYAAFAVDGQPNGTPQLPSQNNLGIRNDIQLRGIKPYESGEFQLGFQYIADYSNDTDLMGNTVPTHGGWGVTLQHVQQVLGGTNKLALQYGKGGGTGFGTLARFYYPDFSLNFAPSDSRFRVVDVITVQPTEDFGAQANIVYQDDHESGNVTKWISAGTRLSYSFAKHAKLLGEAGYDHVSKDNGSAPQWLAKFTVAPAITGAKGFYGRPELRLYYTYAMWDESARVANIDSGQIFRNTNKLSGSIYGLQGEVMW